MSAEAAATTKLAELQSALREAGLGGCHEWGLWNEPTRADAANLAEILATRRLKIVPLRDEK